MSNAKTADMYIIHMLEVNVRLSVEEISRELNMAPSTVRKKLARLEKEGLLIRTHGGAMSLDANRDVSIEKKALSNVARKKAIAAAAAHLIEDGDILAVGGGSTCAELAGHIRMLSRARIHTDSVSIADILSKGTSASLNVLINSGIVRGESGCVVGPSADLLFRDPDNAADKCFLGCEGISLEKGIGVDNILVGEVEKTMLYSAKERYILCDSTKLSRQTVYCIAPLTDITAIITDSDVDPMVREAFGKKGFRMIIA